MTNGVLNRIDDLEVRIRLLTEELQELRATVIAGAPSPAAPPPRTAAPAPRAASQRAAAPTPPPRRPSVLEREITMPTIDLADLLGARALAWAGGVVTLLGVVFFFVLAVNRGWIGPVERVGLGALASLLVFAAGLFVRHRYGQLHSALAAVGAGLAGAYATLLAAAALYGLVPDLAALAIAAGIAAAGTAVSLRWDSETVASIGLVGATLVPIAGAFDVGISALGTAFAGIVFAGAATVAIRREWKGLLVAGAAAAVAQLAWLVADYGEGAPARVVVLAAAFWLLLLAIGCARHEVRGGERLDSLSASFVVGSAVVASTAAGVLLVDEGWALLAIGTTYALLAAGWFARDRELSALLGALALAVGAIAAAALLGGGTLAVTFAAEAALLAWLAHRIAEPRYGIAAIAYLVLAGVHAVAFDTPPHELFLAADHPGSDAPVAAVVGIAALVLAYYAPRWRRHGEGDPAGPIASFLAVARELGLIALGTGVVLLGVAGSLALLELGVAAGSFDWGEVAVTAFWGAVAAAAIVAARGRRTVELYGVGWGIAALAKLTVYDTGWLTADQAGVAALLFGAALLAAGNLGTPPLAIALVPVAGIVAGGGAVGIAGSETADGLALLAVAAPFAALAGLRFRERALATALWGIALVLGLVASILLVEHTELVAVWSGAAVALALLAELARERRLEVGAYGLAGLALGYTLLVLAPPSDLLLKVDSPADGLLALLLSTAALLGVTHRVWETEGGDEVDAGLAELREQGRPYARLAVALLAVYAASLGILGISHELGGDLTTAFQRGHTAVSAFWGTIGLVALYLGLTRASSSLRLAGFALFGVSLAKIFLYDLSRLSSITRALSFLAVGAVLLLAGFFYQRLAAVPPSGLADQRTR